jgi:hypothetical protein
MLIPILAVIVAVLLGVVGFVATRPATFRIERSLLMTAPPAAVFNQVNDFHRWDEWSPWAKIDPSMAQTYEGEPSGKGAIYTWNSKDPKAGQGRMEIMESIPNTSIIIKLQFIKPFAATNTAEFAFTPSGTGTNVLWAMYGDRNFMSKAFSLVMDMDKLVGGDFEKGLAAMSVAAETDAKVD